MGQTTQLPAVTVVSQPAIRRVLDRCGVPCVETVTAEALHRDCFCVAVDPAAVREQLKEGLIWAPPGSQALRLAYLAGAVTVSPQPRAHALWADKRNLSLLGDRTFWTLAGLPSDLQALLTEVAPQTVLVTEDNREHL